MVEHLVCNQGVVGSSPVASTTRLGARIEFTARSDDGTAGRARGCRVTMKQPSSARRSLKTRRIGNVCGKP